MCPITMRLMMTDEDLMLTDELPKLWVSEAMMTRSWWTADKEGQG